GGAEEEEAEGAQADALDVSLGLVGEDRDRGEEGQREGRDGDEEVVPVVGRGEGHEEDAQDDGGGDELLAEEAGGTGELAVAEEAEDGDGEDGPGSAGEDGEDQSGGDEEPGFP